ncbi:hypothetical protein L484_009942 [Morus notabilis]|uniref:Uncharacterized protein n=1 Tax=Morus notabilis TaxID=981085 RepID=W9STH3_9ROSA|nr:hypothetical protein L484_009942 [Morus notabilis]
MVMGRWYDGHGAIVRWSRGCVNGGDSGLGGLKRLSQGWWDSQGAGWTRRSATTVGYEDLTVG